MSISPIPQRSLGSTKTLAAVWLPIMMAVGGFASLIAWSMIPQAPTSDFVDLRKQLDVARSSPLDAHQVKSLDQATQTLNTAQRVIVAEGAKAWQLRSYERARTLLWKAEMQIERARTSPPQTQQLAVDPSGTRTQAEG